MERRLAPFLSIAAIISCVPSPQAKNEAAVTYRVRFSAEPGVVTRVTFPFPSDGAHDSVLSAVGSSDGGTPQFETSYPEGPGLTLEGKGEVEATFSIDRLQGLGSASIPEATLSRQVPDGGVGLRYVRVNKGGSATAQVEFEYIAARDCGAGCGGKRSWTFRGPVGLGPQAVEMTFEENQR